MANNDLVYGWLDTELGELEATFVDHGVGMLELKAVELNGFPLGLHVLSDETIDQLGDNARESMYDGE